MQLMRDYHFKHVECESCLIQDGNPPHLIFHPTRYTSHPHTTSACQRVACDIHIYTCVCVCILLCATFPLQQASQNEAM